MKDLVIKCKSFEEKVAATALCGAYGFCYGDKPIVEVLADPEDDSLEDDQFVHVVIYKGNDKRITYVTESWDSYNSDVVNWSDGLSTIIERLGGGSNKVKISKDYDAIVTKSGIKVGCQTIKFEDFDKLAAIVKKFR